jgi:hypothetical protein
VLYSLKAAILYHQKLTTKTHVSASNKMPPFAFYCRTRIIKMCSTREFQVREGSSNKACREEYKTTDCLFAMTSGEKKNSSNALAATTMLDHMDWNIQTFFL